MRAYRLTLLFLLPVVLCAASSGWGAQLDLSQKAVQIREQIDLSNMRTDIARLSSLETRVTGYETADSASKYVFDRFKEIGLQDVDSREFEITVPIDYKDGELRVVASDGSVRDRFKILPIWPNLVRTSLLANGVKHRVKEGQTLESIAASYRVSVDAILKDTHNRFLTDQAHDLLDNDGDGEIDESGEMALVAGNNLFVPTGGLTGRLFYCAESNLADFNDKDIGGFWYEVKPGDTYEDVGYRFAISSSSIADDILNTYLQRSDDGIDNDEDGEIDEYGETVPLDEVLTWGNDGLDNNGNGLIDEVPGQDNNHDGVINDDDFTPSTEAAIFVPRGGIALVSFNSSTKWINATMLGARAVVFIEPESTIRGEAENKFLTLPANIPRFWISREDADVLLDMLGPDEGATTEITVQLTATMKWEQRIGQNIRGLLPGGDPQLRDELVILQAYYDSMSVVPALAPGAETTSGIAALLELARLFSTPEFRPGRSVLFLATSGHFQGLTGMRAFMEGIGQDVVTNMTEIRRDIYEDLREFQELGRKVVLSIDRTYLVDLPPRFYLDVERTEEDLRSLATTLEDLGNTRNKINSLTNAKRDETEKRKKRVDRTKKREKEGFTPEEQARLQANLAKFKKDGTQTTHFLRKIVEDVGRYKEESLIEARKAEKQLIRDIAIPTAKLDVEAIERLISKVESGQIDSYSRFEHLYTAEELREKKWVTNNLREWEVEKLRRLYSETKILDRHLSLADLERAKTARIRLAKADPNLDYKSIEETALAKAAQRVQQVDLQANQQRIRQWMQTKPTEEFSREDLEFLADFLSSDEVEEVRELRRNLLDEAETLEVQAENEARILNIALRNARLEAKRIQTLIDMQRIERDLLPEEERALAHYLDQDEYEQLVEAHKFRFAEAEEQRLFKVIRSQARNDIVDLQNFWTMIDTMGVGLDEDQKRLLRDNMLTLRNARLRNIHKRIEVISRINREEYERRINSVVQDIALQDLLNQYYTSLFISVDLSTQNHQFGVFGKGWFYDQQPEFVLRREFASIGNKLSEYADNADFGKRIQSLWQFSDDQIKQAVLNSQWGISASIGSKQAIEGKSLETLVSDYYSTLVGLGGVSRLMKLQFELMKTNGEPSEDMRKDMDYIRKEVERFIRNDIRSARKKRKDQIRLFNKLDAMLSLRNVDPQDFTQDEIDDITILLGIVGLGGSSNFVNAISATGGKTWRTYIPGKIAFDSEVATLAGKTGIAFATINDARVLVDTPLDTLNNLNFENLQAQVETLASILVQALRDPQMPTAARVGNYYCNLFGDVVEFDARESALPEKPVPNPILTIRRRHKSMMGVRGDLFVSGDIKGNFEMPGLAMEGRATYRPGGRQEVEAYILDKDSGDIVYAPDLGSYGAKIFNNKIPINTRRRGSRIVVFPCVSTTIYDLVDQRYLRTLRELEVYDAATDSEPRRYGVSKPWVQQNVAASEPIALVYSERGERIKVGMSYGLLGKRLLLIKATTSNVDNPTLYTGEGFVVQENGSIRLTPYVVVRDMWQLDENRYNLYKRFGISSNRLESLHKFAWEYLEASKKELVRKNYQGAMRLARAAWGFESRAYPDVKNTGNDVVKGVMFYLALLLPFAYFMERLLFAFPNVHRQMGATFGIFVIVFFMLSRVHPAFQITVTPLIILIAFVVLALSLIVIVIIVRKFEEQLEQIKRETSKTYKADVGRLSASAAAFSLGVSNMRKRGTRTVLTCITLVILTFTVISFTSVRTFMRPNRTNLPSVTPRYTGFLIRDQYWRQLEEPVITSIMNDLTKTSIPLEDVQRVVKDPDRLQKMRDAGLIITTGQGEVVQVTNQIAPRAWYKSAGLGDQSFVQLARRDPTTGDLKTYQANMLIGMSADEPKITGIDQHLAYGRWFRKDERYACVLPKGVADSIGITETDVISGTASIRVYGADFKVTGVLGVGFKDLQDNDGEELTPVDYQMMQQQRARGGEGEQTLEGELQKYLHLTPDSVAILPYSVVMDQGGTLQSVAVNMEAEDDQPSALTATEKLDLIMGPLMNRIALDFFVGRGRDAFLYSSIGMTSFAGMGNLFIPILIAALIVLNTMLGAVYERVREIGIYSAVGLAPVHVAFLFIAEACVYAIIGAVFGYLLGQTVATTLVHFDLLQGLTLNYSSTSTVTATIIVMAVVLGSTIYPAIKASRMAVPDIERKWKLPDPEGDEWHFDLPFTVLAEEAVGLNIFMRDYFEAHADESASDFYTNQVTFSQRKLNEEDRELDISMMVWLAPYDLGVSQRINLITEPVGEEEEDLYRIYLHVHRESGEIASWKRVNRRFLNLLRKQLLIWRTFNVEVRAEFHQRGWEEEQETTVAGLQPEPAD